MGVSTDRQSLGKFGENLACEELTRRGYAILATRHRTRFGEIDIIAEENGVPAKRRRVAAMALDYLAWTNGLDRPCRFDVVAIDYAGSPRMTLRVIDNAWVMDG